MQFSGFSATALFHVPYSSNASSLTTSDVIAFDLGRPILDFVIAKDGRLWVLVDGEWAGNPEGSTAAVRLFEWTKPGAGAEWTVRQIPFFREDDRSPPL